MLVLECLHDAWVRDRIRGKRAARGRRHQRRNWIASGPSREEVHVVPADRVAGIGRKYVAVVSAALACAAAATREAAVAAAVRASPTRATSLPRSRS
jgi:predicted phage tail protein